MCQIDIRPDHATDEMLQGVAHNLHTSVGDIRMLVEVCEARGDSTTAYVMAEVAHTVESLVNATLRLFRDACGHAHAPDGHQHHDHGEVVTA